MMKCVIKNINHCGVPSLKISHTNKLLVNLDTFGLNFSQMRAEFEFESESLNFFFIL